jgi:hypothetical protein
VWSQYFVLYLSKYKDVRCWLSIEFWYCTWSMSNVMYCKLASNYLRISNEDILKISFPLLDELRPILFLSLYIYEQSCSFSLQNYDQTCSFSLQNYEQGVQHFCFGGIYLLIKPPKWKMNKGGILGLFLSFTPLNIV